MLLSAEPSVALRPTFCTLSLITCQSLPFLQSGLIRQQLGPAPPVTASPGMMMQYSTMFEERRISLDAGQRQVTRLETLAAAAVKVAALCWLPMYR